MISTSLKTGPQAIATPPVWLPQPVVWGNYPEALTQINFPLALRNSLIYAVPSVIGTVLSCSVVAYGFARIRWPGRDIVFLILLATMMLPTQVTFIPLYVTFAKLGWIGTVPAALVPTFLGQPVLHLPAPPVLPVASRRSSPTPPGSTARASCGSCGAIILPLSWPALITVALFTFIDKWGDFFGPLIYLRNPELYPAVDRHPDLPVEPQDRLAAVDGGRRPSSPCRS